MDLHGYVSIVRRRWWLLLLGPLLAAAAAFAYSKQMTPIYQASSTLLVNQTQTPGVVQYNDILLSERLTNTYAELLKRQQVLVAVRSMLNLSESVAQLDAKISVSTIRNTQLLRITVEDPSPAVAALIANTTAKAFIEENNQSLGRSGTVTIADEANVPASPAKPNPKLNAVLAAVLGLVLVASLAFLLEYLDDTVKVSDESEAAIGLPTLGVIRRLKRDKNQTAAMFAAQASEAFVQLRTNVHFAGVGSTLKMLVVTSAGPGEGKSTVSSGLAVLLAQAGERVVLVDTDLRRPTIHRIFRIANSFGLTGLLLSNRIEAEFALMESGTKNLQILPSGPIPPNPADLLISAKMEAVIANLQKHADYVIFDCPPVLAVTDAGLLAARANGTILVAEAGKTRKAALKHAIHELAQTHARILGVVMNKAKQNRHGYYEYYNYSSPEPQNILPRAEWHLPEKPAHGRTDKTAA